MSAFTGFINELQGMIRQVPAHCPIHGNYDECQYLDPSNDRDWISCGCPDCKKEEAERRAKQYQAMTDPLSEKLMKFGIPKIHAESRFDNYQTITQAQYNAKDACRSLAMGVLKNVVIIGSTGIGKTHLAAAVMAEMCKKDPNLDCGYTTEADLYADFDDGRKRGAKFTPSDLVEYWGSHLGFVVIDDVQASPWEQVNGTQMSRLIDRRYCAGLPTMILSNSTAEQFKAHFEDKSLSRLKWKGFTYLMTGEDWRSKHGA